MTKEQNPEPIQGTIAEADTQEVDDNVRNAVLDRGDQPGEQKPMFPDVEDFDMTKPEEPEA